MMWPHLCPQEWKALIDLIQTDPYARDVTIFDPLNEPDAHGLGWDTVGPLYEQFAAYAYSVNPSAQPNLTGACCECQRVAQVPQLLRWIHRQGITAEAPMHADASICSRFCHE